MQHILLHVGHIDLQFDLVHIHFLHDAHLIQTTPFGHLWQEVHNLDGIIILYNKIII
jgi:hypothetical protein